MARQINRLKALNVARAKTPGMYADGNGLYLQVSEGGAKSWIYRYKIDKRERYMGLGPFPTVSLEAARSLAEEQRRLKYDGADPIRIRDDKITQAQLEAARATTFKEAATAYIQDNRQGWRNSKHAAQWESTLERYVYPVFGDIPVQDVDTALVLKVLRPIWHEKPETASRLRGRIERILESATTQGLRSGDNPARLAVIRHTLRPHNKAANVKHHPALPYEQIGAFVKSLREEDGISARALEFTILTAARTNEVIGARWSEFDLEKGIWTIPAVRMKAKREHRVPLSERAITIIKSMDNLRSVPGTEAYVFPGRRTGQPLSNMAMASLLRRMGRDDITVHGFRSTFKDWAVECTSVENIVSEAALAHTVGDATEAAYRRGDLFEKRAQLMETWAAFCERVKNAPPVPIYKAPANQPALAR